MAYPPPPPPPPHPTAYSGFNQNFNAMNMNGQHLQNVPNISATGNMAKNIKDKSPIIINGGAPFAQQSPFGNGNMTSREEEGSLEGFSLRKAEARGAQGPPTWRETTIKSMFHHPDELSRLVGKQKRERERNHKELSDICDELSPNKHKAVDDAVDMRNRNELDSSYRWYLVYLNQKTRESGGSIFSRGTRETFAIELILQRLHKNGRGNKGGIKLPIDGLSNQFGAMNLAKGEGLPLGTNMGQVLGSGSGLGLGVGVNPSIAKQGKPTGGLGQGINLSQQKPINLPSNINLANMGNLAGLKGLPQGAAKGLNQNNINGMPGFNGKINGATPKLNPFNASQKTGHGTSQQPRSNSPIIVKAKGPSKESKAFSNSQFNINGKSHNQGRSNFSPRMKRHGGNHDSESSESESESDSDASYTDDSEETYPSSYSSRPGKYLISSKSSPRTKQYIKPHRSSRRQSYAEGVSRDHRRYPVEPEYHPMYHGMMMHPGMSGMRPQPHRSSSISYPPQYDHRLTAGYGKPILNQASAPRGITDGYSYDDELMMRQEQAMEHQARARGEAYRNMRRR